MSSTWKPIVGWEGLYEVSNQGAVRSLDRLTRHGHRHKGVELKARIDRDGYSLVTLVLDGKPGTKKVHRLIAESFIPNPDNLPWVLHWDDNPQNNTVENLRWGTGRDNASDRSRNGGHYNTRKSHCVRGHAFSEENTRTRPDGKRACLECVRMRNALYVRNVTIL